MSRTSYYLKDNVIIYHGFYQFGLDEDDPIYPGLSLEQVHVLENDIMNYLDSFMLNYITEYYVYPGLRLEKVMVATVNKMTIGTSPDLLLVFRPDGIPSDEFVDAFGHALKHQLEGDSSQGYNYTLPGLDREVLIG
jgi:hypothetical protein